MPIIGAKPQTRTIGNTQTKASSENTMSHSNSAVDLQKIGDQDLGAVLNKVADPNWIDPKKKIRQAGDPNLDKEAFFKLMLAQLKNQDPTNPMQSHEMAAQLAQFSSLEQMQNVNTTLSEMRNAQRPLESFQALNFIGKSISGDSAKVVRSQNDKEHDFKFQLGADSEQVEIKVKASDGSVVRTYKLSNLKAGENKITWNGESEDGRRLGAGDYEFVAEAKDTQGKKIAIKSDFEGQISGVSFGSQGVVLQVGNQSIRMKDVKKIVDPSLMKNDQNLTSVNQQDLKKDSPAGDNKGGKANSTSGAINAKLQQSLGLSPGLAEKLGQTSN